MEESSFASAEYLPSSTHNLSQKTYGKANGAPKSTKSLKNPKL